MLAAAATAIPIVSAPRSRRRSRLIISQVSILRIDESPRFDGDRNVIAMSGAWFSSGRRRVTREHEIAILSRLVAGEARFVQRLIARFAILEVGESPAARRGVLF